MGETGPENELYQVLLQQTLLKHFCGTFHFFSKTLQNTAVSILGLSHQDLHVKFYIADICVNIYFFIAISSIIITIWNEFVDSLLLL